MRAFISESFTEGVFVKKDLLNRPLPIDFSCLEAIEFASLALAISSFVFEMARYLEASSDWNTEDRGRLFLDPILILTLRV